MKSLKLVLFICCVISLSACAPLTATVIPTLPPTQTTTLPPTPSLTPVLSISPSPTPRPLVPDFAHIVVIVFENHEFDVVIGNDKMPNYNRLAQENSLLTQYYAITHPSLPNYIALFGGDTFGITSDCSQCFVNAPSLADQIEASGRTWKAYLEDMPSPCYVGDTINYVQKHNPFIYFDPIRLDTPRCERSIVPLTELEADLSAGSLPNFVYIMPNICHSAHDAYFDPFCSLKVADTWLGDEVGKLQGYLEKSQEPYLIILTWDEGQGSHSCCGLPEDAGGRVATVLISPQAKSGFQDDTPYTHYSLLKTIENAWGLPYLGHAADANNVLITLPWK
jgi:phospholipase C